MRVNDKPPVPGAAVERSAKDAGRSGAIFQVPTQSASVARNAKVSSIFSAVPLDAVLALQSEIDQPVARRKRLVRRGLMMVDKLDQLKVSLLSGQSDARHLDDLATLLTEKREDDIPENLTDLLDAVDVRVAVELAKRGR
jgi:hypothetical protein